MSESDLIQTIDEFQSEYRKGIGTVLPHRPSKEANLDNIRRFGDGVGDYNPLWRDEAHAAASRFGMITAPPPFLYGVTLGVVAGETGAIDRRRVSTRYLPVNYAGAEIEFIRPIWRDDTITAQERVGETIRKTSRRIGPINFNTGLVTFTNQRKEVVATIKTLMARYQNMGHTLEYDRAPRGSDGAAPEAVIEPADPLVWERERRGAEALYWEDVAEGDALPTLRKGTYSVTELFLFTHGVLGTGRSSRTALEAEGSADLGGGGRFDAEHAAKRRNMPGQFDFGPQRVCWLSQIVTDWMGDDGTLKSLSASIRHPNVVGDTNTVYGEVTGKRVAGGEHLVDVQVRNENQSGLPTALGTATVALRARAEAG
jgi:acyl dehydratase